MSAHAYIVVIFLYFSVLRKGRLRCGKGLYSPFLLFLNGTIIYKVLISFVFQTFLYGKDSNLIKRVYLCTTNEKYDTQRLKHTIHNMALTRTMKKWGFLLVLFSGFALNSQAQQVVLKNNLLYDATTTPNLSLEFGTGRKTTFDVQVGLNPFKFDNNSKLKHILVQPEFRYWTCERFNGWFFAAHALGGRFNVGNVKLPFDMMKDLQEHRYEGWFLGGGLGIGYQWVLSRRWSLEAELGGGYVYIDYDKFKCAECGMRVKGADKNYWGVTKAALSLIYVLK